MNADQRIKKVAIVGGGIAGLFCAKVLGANGCQVDLFETASRLGGRIRTLRLDRLNQEMVGHHDKERAGQAEPGGDSPAAAAGKPGEVWNHDTLNFYVEFGPMRLELDKQLLLKALLDELGIRELRDGEVPPTRREGGSQGYLVPFPSYASPASDHDPRYQLEPEEEGRSPLELMSLAFRRILAHLDLEVPDSRLEKPQGKTLEERLAKLKEDLQLAAALSESPAKTFSSWVKELQPEDYWELQRRGCITIPDEGTDADGAPRRQRVPLYRLGFWNLLSNHLSHDALNKVRDLGTFYHLLPENPNAAEWLAWWLLNLSADENMQGIFGGMECIVDELRTQLDERRASVRLHPGCWVTAIHKQEEDGRLRLELKGPSDAPTGGFDHVILAVPRRAAQDIQRRSAALFADPDVADLLESAFGFPMVKTFVVLKERWWEKNNMANRAATRMPTRELHYWKPHLADDRQGLIMAYTDRPASAFWADYVPSGSQIDAHRDRPSSGRLEDGRPKPPAKFRKPLPKILRTLLLDRMADYLDKNNGEQTVRAGDIAWYGIRDWGRAPFSGANHAWRPGRKYWIVMRRLAQLDVADSSAKVHVCGEAYSDYHGFIEGPLRSASYILHRILEPGTASPPFATFLKEHDAGGPDAGQLKVDRRYLEGLRYWARSLDGIPREQLSDFQGKDGE